MALLKYQNSTQTPKQKSKPLWKATPYILTLAIGFYGGNKFEQVSGIKGMLANFGNHLASKYGKTEQTIPIDSTNTVSIDTTINKIANQMPKGETVTNDTTKTAETNKSNIKPEQKSYYEQKLRNAKVITIKERVLNMGRDYDVFAGDEKVATVSGKDIRLAPGVVGDVFKLKTKDGKLLAYEQEHKKFLKLNRVASCYDSEGNLMGYFGEEKIRDLFSFSYVFHFYDAEKNEIGKSKKLGKSALNKHNIYGINGNKEYHINKKIKMIGGDKYELSVYNKNNKIPLEFAIFMTCIEDAIGDANKKSSESTSSKKKD